MKKSIILVLILIGFNHSTALAQLDVASLTTPELTIDLQPEFPQPGEPVTAKLNDYGGGNFGSAITWVLDGEVIPEAENQRQTTITAGEAGLAQKIEVVLNKPQGGKEVIDATIYPIYLDIVIEPQTRVPDFYLGRSLPSIGSIVNATALISDKEFRSSDLIYTWKVNQQVLEGGPIRGRNQVSFTVPRGDEMILTLQVNELNGKVIARRSFIIPSVAPQIYFYEVSSLFGISKKVISNNLTLLGDSVIVRAEPYYLDSRVYNNPDVKIWKINGLETTNTGGNPYEVTLQKVGPQGLSTLLFHVRDTKEILQGAQSSIQINF